MTDLAVRQLRKTDPKRLAEVQQQFEDFAKKMRTALDGNVKILGDFFMDNTRLRDENEQLQADLAALGYSPERPIFFSNIREAIAICRAMWATRRG